MDKRTKIVATLGPACSDVKTLEQLFAQGVNVMRLNCSHGEQKTIINSAQTIHQVAQEKNHGVAILVDLQGPKIRIGKFVNGSVTLANNSTFSLDLKCPLDAGDDNRVGIEYKQLVDECKVGHHLFLDDGLLKFKIVSKTETELRCQVIEGGVLKDRKGINLEGGGLSASALTKKDIQDISMIGTMDVDYVAVSFVKHADDIILTRKLLQEAGCSAHIIAKIERVEAVKDMKVLDDIIQVSDGIMVARGDLGVEVGNAGLVGLQKMLIQRARQQNKVVITATQMMESMISNPVPTRAEVMDVSNAVLDGTDAVMLSAETAVGKYPLETVKAMSSIISGAEEYMEHSNVPKHSDDVANKVDEAIALSAMYAANHLTNITAVLCLTTTGNTPLLMSRVFSKYPIYACSSLVPTLRRMALYRNVFPVLADEDITVKQAIEHLKSQKLIQQQDYVIVTYGDITGKVGGTNNIKIVLV